MGLGCGSSIKMEIAKFVFSSIGTFISVFGLSFSIFQYWKKKQEENFKALKNDTEAGIRREADARQKEIMRIEKRLDNLEGSLVQSMQQRMSSIEGELKGIKPVLQSIQNWFINNTPKG